MDQKDSMAVTVRSFIVPDEPIAGFDLGKPFAVNLPAGMTMEEFTGKLFYKNLDQIGVMVVNGLLASEKTVLLPGDSVDLYLLLDGG